MCIVNLQIIISLKNASLLLIFCYFPINIFVLFISGYVDYVFYCIFLQDSYETLFNKVICDFITYDDGSIYD